MFSFEETRHGNGNLTRAHSKDHRAMLELFEDGGVLRRGNLQLAFPDQDELEMLKLGCWTLLYLKSLFPDWRGVEQWVQECGDKAMEGTGPIGKQLQGYRVACEYHPLPSVMDYEIIQYPCT